MTVMTVNTRQQPRRERWILKTRQKMKNILRATICSLLWISFSIAFVQQNGPHGPSLHSPYATLRTHLYYLQYDSYDPQLAALTIPPTSGSENAVNLAIKLKQILDGRGLYVRLNMTPQDPDYIDSAAMAHIYTPFPAQAPEIYLEKKDSLWYYSQETIDAVPALHRKLYPLGADLLSRRTPDSLRGRFLGIALWQYLGLISIFFCAWLAHLILSRVLRPIVRWIASHIQKRGIAEPEDVMKAARFMSLLFVLFLVAKITPVLQLPIRMSQFLTTTITIVSIVLWVLLGLVLVRILTKRARVLTSATESRMDDQLLPIVRKVAHILVVSAGAIYVLRALDVNVTAMIAGLSIGALALALAAQDTVKNLIGSFMIFLDKPFQVGDFVVLDGQEGTVTEVGFRSTRIQLLDTTIVSIPNGNVANITVSNLGVRTFRLMNVLIGVTYDTPPEKIETFIAELKALIIGNPKIHQENYLVHFREMGDFALKILFRCYIPVFTFAEELQVKEEIYLEIMRIAQRLEIDFAFPSQTIYLEK